MRPVILGMLLWTIAASGCRTVSGDGKLKDTGAIAAALLPPKTSREVYAKPHFGLYFYAPGDHAAEAVPGEENPFFDKHKPTIIYFPGWSRGELTKDKTRTFNHHRDYPNAPDVDLVKVWTDKGWNFGFMDWAQFSDTQFETARVGVIPGAFTYDIAERKIWAANDDDQLVYHLSDGTAATSDAGSVAELMSDKYADFMGDHANPDVEIRFYGHSLGTQLATAVAHILWKRSQYFRVDGDLLPKRLALTDVTASNCAHDWLPSSKPRERAPLPTCVDPNKPGDWVGERLLDYVQDLKASDQRLAVEAYRCWPLSSSGLGGDQVANLLRETAFVEVKPPTGAFDLNAKHEYCFSGYLASMALPPPAVINAATNSAPAGGADLRCADFDPKKTASPIIGGISASADTGVVRRAMAQSLDFVQITAANLKDASFTCYER